MTVAVSIFQIFCGKFATFKLQKNFGKKHFFYIKIEKLYVYICLYNLIIPIA